jgi:hypothetical protein
MPSRAAEGGSGRLGRNDRSLAEAARRAMQSQMCGAYPLTESSKLRSLSGLATCQGRARRADP